MAAQHSPGFLKIVEQVRANIRECTVEELKQRLDGPNPPVLIDVREESEFEAGHVPGAVHLSKGIIERDIESRFPDTSTELYLLCGGDSDRHSQQITCRRWATRELSVLTVVGAGGLKRAFRGQQVPEPKGT